MTSFLSPTSWLPRRCSLSGPVESDDQPAPDGASELADGSLTVSATSPRDAVMVVRAIGEVDLLTAPAWRRVLTAAARVLAPGPASRLVCDLSSVSFLGASAIGVLVELAEAHCSGTDLVLACPPGQAQRLLALTGLDRRFPVADRLDEAVDGAFDGAVPR